MRMPAVSIWNGTYNLDSIAMRQMRTSPMYGSGMSPFPQETRELFVAIRNLIAENKAVIFISHKLNEVMEISKVITILHLGKVVGSVLASETNAKQLASMMVGKEVSFETPKGEQKLGDVMLEVVDMHAKNSTGVETVRGLNMKVRAGEIYGIAGVDGNGQS